MTNRTSELRWTPQDDLIALRTDISIGEKAFLLGRSYDAVITRRSKMRTAGIDVPRTYVRSYYPEKEGVNHA